MPSTRRQQVRHRLRYAARILESWSDDPAVAPSDARLGSAYAPFLWEISARDHAVDSLASVDADVANSIDESLSPIERFVDEWRLPDFAPWQRDAWGHALLVARIGPPLPKAIRKDVLPRLTCEIHLDEQDVDAPEHVALRSPLARSAIIEVRRGWLRRHVRTTVRDAIGPGLVPIHRKILRAACEPARRRLYVSLLISPADRRLADLFPVSPIRGMGERTLNRAFTISYCPGMRRSVVCRRIADEAFETLGLRQYAPQGPPPKADQLARWWALRALDGLTAADIFRDENLKGIGPATPETIERALRRLELGRGQRGPRSGR